MAATNTFLTRTAEKEEFNQYWYSENTIKAMVQEVLHVGGRAAFLSTPSVYFSLTAEQRQHHAVFDLDDQWKSDAGFVKWDFRTPTEYPELLKHAFDVVVIDPPFITREVWELYTTAAKSLLKTDEDGKMIGKIIASTIYENADMMKELLACERQTFLPSIPHLVYQYNFFCNFDSEYLSKPNPEIPE